MNSPVVVVADEPRSDLAHLWSRTRAGQPTVVEHDGAAIGWDATSPWIDMDDGGDVLVLVDGRLHDVARPSTDTRPCPAARVRQRYERDGDRFATGLLGDLVALVLDRRRRRILIARDPVGVRPWYQAIVGRRYLGAGDLATLTVLPWVDTSIDEQAAIEHLAALPRSVGRTLYRGIGTLRPGRTLCLEPTEPPRTIAHHRWAIPVDELRWDEAVERCRERLDIAVRTRVHAAGSATSQLSGGVDSSIIVGTAVALAFDDLVVGRLLFDGPRADERAYSDAVLAHWGLGAVSVPPHLLHEDEAEELTRQLRRPLPDPNFVMFLGLHAALRDAGRIDGLTGHGGDDAFVTMSTAAKVVSAVQRRDVVRLRTLAGDLTHRPRTTWHDVLKPTLALIAPWKGRSPPPWVRADASERADLAGLLREPPPRVTGVRAIDERIANLSDGYGAAILEEQVVVTDLARRRDSHPYLDPRLIEVTYGVDPWWATLDGGYRALQLAAFADRLPPAVARRRSKAEFSEVFWPQLLSERTVVEVRGGPLHEAGWLDPDGFDDLVGRARSGMANSAIPLARCRSLDRWMRTC